MYLTAKFKAPVRTYRIVIETSGLSRAGELIRRLSPSRVFILTNTTLKRLHYNSLKSSLAKSGLGLRPPLVIPDGERFKSLEYLSHGYDQLVKDKADRDSLLVTLGG